MKNDIPQDTDILDIVRRLRGLVSDLDNCNFLTDKIKVLSDTSLTKMIEQTAKNISNVTQDIATILKSIENNRKYKEIVKRYRAPSVIEEVIAESDPVHK